MAKNSYPTDCLTSRTHGDAVVPARRPRGDRPQRSSRITFTNRPGGRTLAAGSGAANVAASRGVEFVDVVLGGTGNCVTGVSRQAARCLKPS